MMITLLLLVVTLLSPAVYMAVPPPARNKPLFDTVFQPILGETGTTQFVQNQVDQVFDKIKRICNQDDPLSNGICMFGPICSDLNGKPVGSGCVSPTPKNTCCMYERTCGEQEMQAVVYFKGDSNKSNLTGGDNCDFVLKTRLGSCQLRVDFLDFNVSPPDPSTGRCHPNNSLEVIQDGKSILPAFCGMNTGNHFYLPLAGTLGQTVTFRLRKTTTDFENWNIKITQIDCRSQLSDMLELQAPEGCLQYFSDRRGPFASFNFDGASPIQPEQNYSICFRSNASACALVLKSFRFELPSSPVCADGSKLMDGNATCCSESYFEVTEPVDQTSMKPLGRNGRFCGMSFGNAENLTLSRHKPFDVFVKVGAKPVGSSGFLMAYELPENCH